MSQTTSYLNNKIFLSTWVLLSILLIISYLISFRFDVGTSFFLMLNLLNMIFVFIMVIFKNKIEGIISNLINKFNSPSFSLSAQDMHHEYRSENKFGLPSLLVITLFGIFIMTLSLFDVQSYTSLIREDGVVEYGSSIFWFFAALILFASLTIQKRRSSLKRFYALPYLSIILFFVVCSGEEISWGQRIFDIETPELLKRINVQQETTLHNIGSISVFSNVFFLITIGFFILVPFLSAKYDRLRALCYYCSFPIPNRFAVYVFLVTLFIWLFVGIRFGTLGFHPFSFHPENYYTQMDDEIFEFLAAYSFFVFAVMDTAKRIRSPDNSERHACV